MKIVSQKKVFDDMDHHERMSYICGLFNKASARKKAFKLSDHVEVIV